MESSATSRSGRPSPLTSTKTEDQTEVCVCVGDAGLDADVGEGAIAVVMEEMIRLATESAGSAHNRHAAKVAEGDRSDIVSFCEIGEIEVNVAGNEQIETAIPVVVAPGRSGRPVAEGHAGLFGDVGERAIVIVVVEPILCRSW